ncbi:MAG: hypothetical protein CMD83_17925 [Gammaproteobacteria bacterium]|nr:hypothetical protein [Gammaproteobacteria bacterium]
MLDLDDISGTYGRGRSAIGSIGISHLGITFEVPQSAGFSPHRADFVGFAGIGCHHKADALHIHQDLSLPDVNIFNIRDAAMEGMDKSINVFLNFL